jgi:hypothetical protein
VSSAVGIGSSRNVSQYKSTLPNKGGTDPARLNPTAQDVGDDPIKLQDGFLSCRTCGIAVQRPGDVADEIRTEAAYPEESAAVSAQNPLRIADRSRTTLSFALCPAHRRTQELAEQLVDTSNHPIYRERMACALDALSFVAPQTVEHMAHLDREGLTALVRHLAQLGQTARWVSRFSPVITPGADPQTCCRYAWAHLGIGLRSDLRGGYAKLLKERASRSAPAVPITPPRVTDRGAGSNLVIPVENACLFCGLGHQLVPAVEVAQLGRLGAARQLWTPLRCSATSLGEQSSLELSGHLCRVCADAADHVHSIGPSALERSLTSHLRPDLVPKLDGWNQVTMSGLVGWAALVARAQQGSSSGQPAPKANARAWEHLGDLDALSEQLGAALG